MPFRVDVTVVTEPILRQMQNPSPFRPTPFVFTNAPLKFAHLTSPNQTVAQLATEIRSRFAKIYPNRGTLEIFRIQDSRFCDLDPDYELKDLFSDDAAIFVVADDVPQEQRKRPHSSILAEGPKSSKARKTAGSLSPTAGGTSSGLTPALASHGNGGLADGTAGSQKVNGAAAKRARKRAAKAERAASSGGGATPVKNSIAGEVVSTPAHSIWKQSKEKHPALNPRSKEGTERAQKAVHGPSPENRAHNEATANTPEDIKHGSETSQPNGIPPTEKKTSSVTSHHTEDTDGHTQQVDQDQEGSEPQQIIEVTALIEKDDGAEKPEKLKVPAPGSPKDIVDNLAGNVEDKDEKELSDNASTTDLTSDDSDSGSETSTDTAIRRRNSRRVVPMSDVTKLASRSASASAIGTSAATPVHKDPIAHISKEPRNSPGVIALDVSKSHNTARDDSDTVDEQHDNDAYTPGGSLLGLSQLGNLQSIPGVHDSTHHPASRLSEPPVYHHTSDELSSDSESSSASDSDSDSDSAADTGVEVRRTTEKRKSILGGLIHDASNRR